jgi:hypothetical protein
VARRLRALALVGVLAACAAPQAPPSLRPAPLPVASRIVIPITPHCNYGQFSDFTFTPPVGVVPPLAWYVAIDATGPQPALHLAAGQQAVIVRPSNAGPWQLYMLTTETLWAPVSNIVVNYPGVCV